MKAISLWDPWGTLVAIGAKRYETRSWATRHRGPIAIHVAQAWNGECARAINQAPIVAALETRGVRVPFMRDLRPVPAREARRYFPLGCIVAVADLTACIQMTPKVLPPPPPERSFGDFRPGRWAWRLERVVRLPEPIPCRGAQGLWDVPAEIAARLEELAAHGAPAAPASTTPVPTTTQERLFA